MKTRADRIHETLESVKALLESHKCYMQLHEVTENEIIIYCGGQGAACDSKCVEDLLKEKFPDMKVVFR